MKTVGKLLKAVQDIIEQDIYDDLWTKFIKEQEEQMKRMDKIIQDRSEIVAKKVAKDLQQQIKDFKD